MFFLVTLIHPCFSSYGIQMKEPTFLFFISCFFLVTLICFQAFQETAECPSLFYSRRFLPFSASESPTHFPLFTSQSSVLDSHSITISKLLKELVSDSSVSTRSPLSPFPFYSRVSDQHTKAGNSPLRRDENRLWRKRFRDGNLAIS